ncbi:MAG TPA: hypothetical protein VHZ81_06800 [Galbitalea sp.]|nr:hypothetical protein [Galbitalea sp.]
MAKGGGQRKLAKFLANGWTIASQTQLHPFGDKLTLFTLTKGA